MRFVTPYVVIPRHGENTATHFHYQCRLRQLREMVSISHAFDPEHPLLEDRERLNKIADVMYFRIQKTLFPGNPQRRSRTETERIVSGNSVSADDVLSEALVGLLQYSPERLEGTWEAVAVGIAHKKAVDALRASQKGLGSTDHRHQLHLVSGDAQREGPSGKTKPPLFEVIPINRPDPEAEFLELEYVVKLRNLGACAVEDSRDESGC